MSSRLTIVRDELLEAWLAPIIGCEYRNLLVVEVFFNQAYLIKGGEIRDTKTLNLSRKIVSLQVLGRCFAFFTLRD